MKWTEKILALLQGKNASHLSESVGLHKSAIRDAANNEQLPRVDKAIKIARALNVPADWLFDDAQDLPAPDRPTLATYTDQAVTSDLARRRELIRQSMHEVAASFTPARKARLISLAKTGVKTDTDRADMDAGKRDLARLHSLNNQLEWLDPDKLHPPKAKVVTVQDLLKDWDSGILNVYFDAVHHFSIVPPIDQIERVAGVAPGKIGLARTFGIGELVPRDLITGKGPSRGLVPLHSATTPVPAPEFYTGGYDPDSPPTYFLRYNTDAPHAFAVRVYNQAHESVEFADGSIVICDPDAEIHPDTYCVVISTEHHGAWRITRGGLLLDDRGEVIRTARGRKRFPEKIFPIIGRVSDPIE